MHQRGDGQQGDLAAHALLHHLLGPLHPGVGVGVDATAQRVEDVLVSPDHPLGHAGGAAGVEDVVVVVGPGGEVPLGAPRGHRLLVGDGAPGERLAGPVVDGDHQSEVGELGQQLGHLGPVAGLVDQGDQVGVGEQVAELVLHVAVVDVDPHGPQLEHRPGRLHPLHAVERVDADVVAGADPLGGQEVGQPVGPGLHLGEGAALARGHQVLAVPEGVDRRLEQISQVERHRPVSRTRFDSGGKHLGRGGAGGAAGRWRGHPGAVGTGSVGRVLGGQGGRAGRGDRGHRPAGRRAGTPTPARPARSGPARRRRGPNRARMRSGLSWGM